MAVDIVFDSTDFDESGVFYNEGFGWEPIGTEELPFSGIFNGNGHTISGIEIDISNSPTITVGLFAYNSGTISNLELSSVRIDAEVYNSQTLISGGIAGVNTGNVLRSCDGCIQDAVELLDKYLLGIDE